VTLRHTQAGDTGAPREEQAKLSDQPQDTGEQV